MWANSWGDEMSKKQETATAPVAHDWQPQYWLCLGYKQQRTKPGELAMAFVPLQDTGELPLDWEVSQRIFAAKGFSTRPGAVYKVFADADYVKMGADSFTFIRMWQDTGMVGAWQTASRAADLAVDAHRGMERLTKYNYLLEGMEPLRRLYQNTSWQQQKMIELLVLDYLRRHVND
jgi:hypothetical protein